MGARKGGCENIDYILLGGERGFTPLEKAPMLHRGDDYMESDGNSMPLSERTPRLVRKEFSNEVKKCNSAAGFTLVEILIAMAILTIFISSLFVVFKNSLEAWKKSEARLTVYQNARIVLEQMSREINCALVNDFAGVKFVSFASGSGKKSQKDEIYFTASLENSGRYDLCAIGYWLDEEDKELMRYLQRDSKENPLDFDFENLSSGLIGSGSSQLGLNVTNLQFKFHYRDFSSSWAVTKTAAWDSGADNIANYDSAGNLKNPDGLPNAVEIVITVQDSASKEQKIFSTLVYIPQA